MNTEGIMAGPYVMRTLKDIIFETVNVHSYQIDVCCEEHQQYWLNSAIITVFLRLCIHHFVKICNRELKQLQDKKRVVQRL